VGKGARIGCINVGRLEMTVRRGSVPVSLYPRQPGRRPQRTGSHTFVLADLAGYTALTEAHGDEHAAEFCAAVRALLDQHGAEEVKVIGDAMLVRVSEPDQALRLAARIVSGYGARHRRLGIRVGVHTGTAVRRDGDWFGSAVNLASRVADLARAGEVLLTDATRQTLQSGLALRELGPRSFKNVAEQRCTTSPSGRGASATPAPGRPPSRCRRRR
jgi:class 3 adenylate cyclase